MSKQYILRGLMSNGGFEYIQHSWKTTTVASCAKVFMSKDEAIKAARALDYIGLNRRPNTFQPVALADTKPE